MPNLPIRNLGAVGVMTDPDPFNLPINAFTRAKNVRFDQGDVVRSPCFRDVASIQPTSETFVVTVVNDGGVNKFAIDGVTAPTLSLIQGVTYTFDMSSNTLSGHPLAFKDASGTSYTTNVSTSGSAGSAGATVTIAVPTSGTMPGRYYCTAHGDAMGNTISTSSATSLNPMFVAGVPDPGTFDTVVVVSDNFNIYNYANGNVTLDYSPGASNQSIPITSTSLANVTYLNRSDLAPHYKTKAMSNFASLANWPSGFRCNSLRSFGDFLIALNTTEGGANFPQRVRFSNIALANNAPNSWDETDTTKSAGFNDLAQMVTPIIDGETLGSNFIVYSTDQVWQMEFVGGTFIFNFRKLFQDRGIINQNCAVEVSGKHYVFDADDIYVHDGLSDQSIVDGRIRDYIYSGIDTGSLERCFVQYDPVRQDIYFCYKSSDDMAEFTNGSGCNRAAVYNPQTNTWSFMDLPNIFAGTVSNVDTVATYATVASNLTYATAGGSFVSQIGGLDRHVLMLSNTSTSDGLTSHNIFALDGIDENTSLSNTINSAANKPIKLERVGIDLDQEAQLPLAGYKNVKKMVPQFSTVAIDKTFNVSLGAADLPNEVPAYETAVTLNTSVDHKVDSRAAGRYLSYKVETPTNKDFVVSGFDFDVVATGGR